MHGRCGYGITDMQFFQERKKMTGIDERQPKKRVNAVRTLSVLAACALLAVTVVFSMKLLIPAAPEPVPAAELMPLTAKPEAEPLPEPGFEPFVSRELKQAWEENNDVIGWITVDGCGIDNRVFQAKDNDYYLRRNEKGEHDVWGCYFLDYKNSPDENAFNDRVQIVYGHSLKDDPDSEKFSKLKYYLDKKFAKEHPYIYFSTLYQQYEWEIFACTYVPVTLNYIAVNPDDEKFRKVIIDYIAANTNVDFGVKVKKDDRILILSTCTSDTKVRYVVAARLVGPVDATADE